MRESLERAVLIGLDGTNHESMKTLLEKGMLPNLEHVLCEGTSCLHTFSFPTLTDTLWPTIATGS